jgi:hypothetical protein
MDLFFERTKAQHKTATTNFEESRRKPKPENKLSCKIFTKRFWKRATQMIARQISVESDSQMVLSPA